jgi:hypothetical protein
MKKLAVLSTAALMGLGSMAASTTDAEARWRGRHHGGAVAAGLIGGLAAGALIGAATNAYAAPSYGYGYGYAPAYSYGYAPAYSYGYAPASYGYAQTAYYDDDYVTAPVYRTRVVRRAHYAPVYRQRIVRAHYAPAYRMRAVRAHYAPAYGARVVRGYGPARAHGYTRASHWGGQRVSYGHGSRGHWR